MAEWTVTPVVEIIKWFISPIKLRVGYFFQHEKKIGRLRTKVTTLRILRSDLQLRVEAAEKNLETISRRVKDWLVDVVTQTTENETMVAIMNGQALDQIIRSKNIERFTCRYCVGKLISKKTIIIDLLIHKGSNFPSISFAGLVQDVNILPRDADFESFPSRECVMRDVLTALEDDGINLIGVYGMGGIGKTVLINKICSQVKEDKLFEVVVIVTVSQNVEMKRIQGKIAQVLEYDGIKQIEDETIRAAFLSKRLMREQSILIVLDDLWTEDFNLNHAGIPYGDNKGCKVVITSRIHKEFCGCHVFQKNIEVKTIKEDESWGLFTKNVGDAPDSVVAREIVKECNGLPIALVVHGRALRNKDTLFLIKNEYY